jgi:hypothetical protein
MYTELYVCLDLGNDTLKISFAYENGRQETYGKLNVPDLLNQVAYPAAAFYDTDANRWLFAEELEKSDNKNFSTVVKIKEILSLITKQEDEEIEKRNSEYYRAGHYFPQFSFPVKRKIARDFQYLVDNKLVFEVPAYTPRKMCEEFFVYMKKQIESRIQAFSKSAGVTFGSLNTIVIVHPPKLGIGYVTELSRLVKNAFGKTAHIKDITSTQALGLYALHKQLLSTEEKILLFDMGDETISVAKVWANEVSDETAEGKKMGILVDVPNAHLAPLDIGGCNIDETINAYLENAIHHRETIGSPSSGQPGHIYEDGLCSNQYLFMKDIKKAKMLMQKSGSGMFGKGIPISIRRETLVQKMLTPDEFKGCVGTTDNTGVARAVLDYIKKELRLAVNKDVRKLLLAGGTVETFGLVSFIRDRLAGEYPHVEILTFENSLNDKNDFHIQFFETATYAASLGGAVAEMKNYSLDTALSYSYGTWLFNGKANGNRKCLEIFAERGSIISEDGQKFTKASKISLSQQEEIEVPNDEMYSTIISSKDIVQRLYGTQITYDPEGRVVIGDKNEPERLCAEKAIELRTVSGGTLHYYYGNARVALFAPDRGSKETTPFIHYEEGFAVDKKGVAVPIFQNLKSKNQDQKVRILKFDQNGNLNKKGQYTEVDASDIEFRLSMGSILVTTND